MDRPPSLWDVSSICGMLTAVTSVCSKQGMCAEDGCCTPSKTRDAVCEEMVCAENRSRSKFLWKRQCPCDFLCNMNWLSAFNEQLFAQRQHCAPSPPKAAGQVPAQTGNTKPFDVINMDDGATHMPAMGNPSSSRLSQAKEEMSALFMRSTYYFKLSCSSSSLEVLNLSISANLDSLMKYLWRPKLQALAKLFVGLHAVNVHLRQISASIRGTTSQSSGTFACNSTLGAHAGKPRPVGGTEHPRENLRLSSTKAEFRGSFAKHN